eukprot:gene1123-477_t
MAAIKLLTTGKRGAFGVSDDPMAKHHVEPWFENPFDSDLKVFLKNMVNAYLLQETGNKSISDGKIRSYVWMEAIVGMWKRECSRVEAGAMRMVPKLLPSYIQRDAWTKLNVAPAKIVQFKFETNSKLNSVNYANARSRVLMKKDISGSAKAAHGYRDTPLYVKDKELKRKSKK